jgi:hypothetical protein
MLSLQPVVAGDGKAARLSSDCRELVGANAEPVLTLLLQFPNGTSVLLEVTEDSPAKTASAGSRSFIMVTSEVVSLDAAAALPGNEQILRID